MRGGMVDLRGRSGRRNVAPLTPAPDLDPVGAGGAAEAGREGEGEGRWRRRVRELGERGRPQGRGGRENARRVWVRGVLEVSVKMTVISNFLFLMMN